MDIGTYIKILRKEKKLSQEELGNMLTPSVNKAAINKWETGKVENIKRTHITQLAKIFEVSPIDLMCFEDEGLPNYSNNLSLQIQKQYGKEYVLLFEKFSQLNKIGREKIFENINDFLQLEKYTAKKTKKKA